MRTLLVGLLLASSLSFARDPFARTTVSEPPPAQCTTSLCKHDLSDLRLVAISSGGADPVAMLENGSGKGFVARRNTQIGTAGARVTRIERGCLTLTRFTAAPNGHLEPIVERLCFAEELIAEHDYLTDGPYRIP